MCLATTFSFSFGKARLLYEAINLFNWLGVTLLVYEEKAASAALNVRLNCGAYFCLLGRLGVQTPAVTNFIRGPS